jgi:glycosyltransferase involved in cell wall biosynthesis
MYYLKNPGGRIVCFDTLDQFNKWENQPGFTIPTQEVIDSWQKAKIQAAEARARAVMIEKQGGEIFFATVSGGNDGYGVSSQALYNELQAQGVKISYSNIGQAIGFLYHSPYSMMRVNTPYRILYTMFESTKIPDDWHDYLHAANKVIVPSKWCRDIFRKSGFDPEVVPLGYDDNIFKFQERENKRRSRKNFVFLHYNAYNIRKGFIEVVKAFTQEFAKDEPVKMIFKTNQTKPPFPFIASRYPNIEVITGEMDAVTLAELCHRSDAFVFPSRGEGFGMTPLEAMATGMPAIIPNAHGITEYFNPECMYEVKIGSMCPAIYSRYRGMDVGQMYVSDISHLRSQMRYVYEHQDEAMAKGRAASEYVKQWTYKVTAGKLKDTFRDIMSQPLPERKTSNILTLEQV